LALAWREFTLDNIRAGAEAGPERYLKVTFEDLIREPEAVLRVVTAFLHEEYVPEMLSLRSTAQQTVAPVAMAWQGGALGAIDQSRHGRWRDDLSRRQRSQVEAVVHRELQVLGYPLARGRRVAYGILVNAFASSVAAPASVCERRQQRRLSAADRYDRVHAYMRAVADKIGAGDESAPLRDAG
jgi:hypothetical protein